MKKEHPIVCSSIIRCFQFGTRMCSQPCASVCKIHTQANFSTKWCNRRSRVAIKKQVPPLSQRADVTTAGRQAGTSYAVRFMCWMLPSSVLFIINSLLLQIDTIIPAKRVQQAPTMKPEGSVWCQQQSLTPYTPPTPITRHRPLIPLPVIGCVLAAVICSPLCWLRTMFNRPLSSNTCLQT
jgi:hypothetical protein